MIAQILRTVLIGAAVYYLSKMAKRLIDSRLDSPERRENLNRPNDQAQNQKTGPARLTACPDCGTYYSAREEHVCED